MLDFHSNSRVKNLPAMQETCRKLGLIPDLRRSPGKGNGNPLQYSCLGNPKDREGWRATVHGVAEESNMAEQLNNNKVLHITYCCPRSSWVTEWEESWSLHDLVEHRDLPALHCQRHGTWSIRGNKTSFLFVWLYFGESLTLPN